MMSIKKLSGMSAAILFSAGMVGAGCNSSTTSQQAATDSIRLMVLAPGHFHAALVQKSMYDEISPRSFVYGPKGPETDAYLSLIDKYNTRAEDPTHWAQTIYTEPDYLEKMLEQKPGNLLILAGNNQQKTDYIKKAVDASINVLSDKPMAIDASGFDELKQAFESAAKNKVLLYDIMTERYEITNMLQKELAWNAAVFGQLEKGTPDNPAIAKESVHHFFKEVSGAPLIRPAWYYDVLQEGNGLVDVTTHLVDLIQWTCFPDQVLDYQKDINMLSAKRWTTPISLAQYTQSTKQTAFPEYLQKDVKDNVLGVYSNGEMNYTLKGTHAKVSVVWNFQAPAGSGDTHYSILRGSKANLIIRQGAAQNYKPILYIEPVNPSDQSLEPALQEAIKGFQAKYAGVSVKKADKGWELVIPDALKSSHEAHFSEVTRKYLQFLKDGKLPDWEVPGMLAKYYTTTQALQKAMNP
jgi:predicted dehydrogenase